MQPLPELYDEQSRGCPTQEPAALHWSLVVQLFPSLQEVPTGAASVHWCVVSLHVAQPPEALQSIGVPTQFPLKSHWSVVEIGRAHV